MINNKLTEPKGLSEQKQMLIHYLRYGPKRGGTVSHVWHSIAHISLILSVPIHEVRQVLDGERCIHQKERKLKKEKLSIFNPQQREFLTSDAVLESWSSMTLEQRIIQIKKLYPREHHTAYQLRRLYKTHCIKQRPVGISVCKTQSQLNKIHQQKLVAFPQVIGHVESEKEVIFVDEACYSHQQNKCLAWMAKNQKICAQKKQLGFTCIAAIAGINMKGEVVATLIKEFSIKKSDVVEFLRLLGRRYRYDNIAIYWDNLRGHYSKEVVEEIERQQMDVIYAPPYSSEFNCVELLWCFSKKVFRKKCLLEFDYKHQDKIMKLVMETIYDVPRETLKKHAESCLRAMRIELQKLGHETRFRSEQQTKNQQF